MNGPAAATILPGSTALSAQATSVRSDPTGFHLVGARIHFRGPEAQALPYLTVGYSGRAASLDLYGDPFTISGAGPSFGGGVLVFFSPSAALDLGLKWTVGTFTEAEYQGEKADIDVSATSARFNVGLAWWAGRQASLPTKEYS